VVLHRGGVRNPVVFAMSPAYMAVVLGALLLLVFALFRLLGRGRSVRRQAAWDGGLRALAPDLTYTATGFSNPVRVVFDAVLKPTVAQDTTRSAREHFRTAVRREYRAVHVVDRFLLEPTIGGLVRFGRALRWMHTGNVHAYAGYVLLTALLFLIAARAPELARALLQGMGIGVA